MSNPLDKMAENARELGLDYEPAQQKESMRPYRQLQDNGSKYFGDSWDKAEQPAQRTWVGLTLEDMETTHWSPDFRAGAKWAAAKLKEKNHG